MFELEIRYHTITGDVATDLESGGLLKQDIHAM